MEYSVGVSVICNVYNHEKYIKNTLESFVMQKTDFPFEVLVHDDASTDKSANIIREFEKKYPDIIKPIYQSENQYSKGVKITVDYQMPRVKGKYVALCEGDDYWTDPYKLQKQFDAMEKHPEIDMCAHQAEIINAETNAFVRFFSASEEDAVFSVEQVISGGGGFVATNSLFYRSEIDKNMPSFRKIRNMDITIQIHGALRGGMLYLKDCMSVYRVGVTGSWTTKNKKNTEFRVKNYRVIDSIWEQVDKDTDHKYAEVIREKRAKNAINMCHDIMTLKELRKGQYKEFYKKLPLKKKFKITLKYLAPGVLKIKRKLLK